MTYRQLAAYLREQGCEFRREAKGSHEIWWHPAKRLYTTVPRHPGDVDVGTLRKILSDLELPRPRLVRRDKGRGTER